MLLHISFKTDIANILKQFLLIFTEANKVLFCPSSFLSSFLFFPCFWASGADCTKVRDEPEVTPEPPRGWTSGPSFTALAFQTPSAPPGASAALGVQDQAEREPGP